MVTTLVRDDPGRAGAYSSYNRQATRSLSARPTFGEDLPTPPGGDLRSARVSRPRRSAEAAKGRKGPPAFPGCPKVGDPFRSQNHVSRDEHGVPGTPFRPAL